MQTQEQFITEQKAKDLDAAIAAAIAPVMAKVSCLEAELASLKATPIMAKVSCLEAELASLKAKMETGNAADRVAANPGVPSRDARPSRIPTPVTHQRNCFKISR